MTAPSDRIRLDKWLWQARFFKTRALSARVVSGGHVRVNSVRVSKPAHGVGAGDVLTFAQAQQVRVVRIVAIGIRRGPAAEARGLYDDLDPPDAPAGPAVVRDAPRPHVPRYEGGGRPTKRDRRRLPGRGRDALE